MLSVGRVHGAAEELATEPIDITGEEVETVDGCRCFDVHLNDSLGWRTNSDAVYGKGVSRLYFSIYLLYTDVQML